MTLIEQLETLIAEREAELQRWRHAHEAIRRAMAPMGSPGPQRGPSKRTAAGSLEDRIISAAMSPATLSEIVKASNARGPDVKAAVKRLVRDGKLTKTGKSRGTRYTRA